MWLFCRRHLLDVCFISLFVFKPAHSVKNEKSDQTQTNGITFETHAELNNIDLFVHCYHMIFHYIVRNQISDPIVDNFDERHQEIDSRICCCNVWWNMVNVDRHEVIHHAHTHMPPRIWPTKKKNYKSPITVRVSHVFGVFTHNGSMAR